MLTRLRLAVAMLPWVILQFFSMMIPNGLVQSLPVVLQVALRPRFVLLLLPLVLLLARVHVRHRVLNNERLKIFAVQRSI